MAGTDYPARGVPALLMAIGFVAFGISPASVVSYNPSNVSGASGPENDSETAFLEWALAALLIGFGGWLSFRVLTGTSRTPAHSDLLEHRT
ncbi:MAG TPA: hypothetical protein VHY81_08545 [Acidimicrobiales bacterium]|nr:hypothetical protein [Acidimicrobiales bacterium]